MKVLESESIPYNNSYTKFIKVDGFKKVDFSLSLWDNPNFLGISLVLWRIKRLS